MHLTIKNAEYVHVTPASEVFHLDVHIDGLEIEDILVHIDIVKAIKYYGMTELLDTIGEEHLKSHLECLKVRL
ncbi:hypothetical protein [Pedobacter nutrimenti]|jgi:hypothetical protein|uniref:Uncharacterized protein n=1 Tax=Pedobacter nutrimenti TaxID=1241337 RepID=A0A318UEC8_9SPHI|nr:hypothetical protein [Pedobacter nutrimenti]PYF73009.1 hypothetical protein B0O44_105384 [Pedobacter nutrimenti]